MYVKIPLKSSAILNTENDDKYCFLWSISAKLRPCKDNHLNRVSTYRQYFDEFNIQGFDFTNRFKCSDVHRFEKFNELSIIMLELSFGQGQNEWKPKLIPIEISKSNSDNSLVY